MSFDERAFFFACNGESLPGIVACPRDDEAPPGARRVKIGVLIVVGGPQYRVGSHRLFVTLARALAEAGVPCMRFDRRGMGDASGEPRPFDEAGDDIRAALDAFFGHVPDLTGVLLWGLCDGASAVTLYAADGPRVDGLLLLNPWVHTESGEAQVFLRNYYPRRLRSRAFWTKLLRGGIQPVRALRDYLHTVHRARGTTDESRQDLPERMALALKMLAIPWWVILSGKDFVANEFERVATGPDWIELLPARVPYRLPEADHTFSRAVWRDEVAKKSLSCVHALTDIVKLLESL